MTKSKAAKARAKAAARSSQKRMPPPPRAQAKKKKKAFGIPSRKQQMRPRGGISSGLTIQRGGLFGEITKMPFREECLGSISTAVAFTNTTFVLNAANLTTFPWLAAIAAKYEYYRFGRLQLRFVSSSADAVGSTNTALGTMLFNTNYDVLDAPFASQIQMEDYGGQRLHSETLPSKNITHQIEPQGVRGGVAGGFRLCLPSSASTAAGVSYPSSSSAHDYDIGLLQCASVGAQVASVAGRLYIGYQVDLANPKLETPLGQAIVAAHFTGVPVSTSAAFGSMVVKSSSNFNSSFTGTTCTIPSAGRWLVVYSSSGSTSTTGGQSFTAGAGGTLVSTAFGQSGLANTVNQLFVANSGAATQNSICVGLVDTTVPNVVLTFTSPTIVGTAVCDLLIIQWPGALSLTEDQKEQEEIDELRATVKSTNSRLARLESLLSGRASPLYEESKSDDDQLEKSVHIDRAALEKLLLPSKTPRLERQ